MRADEEVNPPGLEGPGRIRVEFGVAPTIPGEFIRMRMEQPSGAWTIYLD